MLLVGDIGGTKTVLALYSIEKGFEGAALQRKRYDSRAFNSLERIVADYLMETGAKPVAASFGVAGPVKHGQAKITNLPWLVSVEGLRQSTGITSIFLTNDLESIATAVPHLEGNDILTLNEGSVASQGNIAVIAPGTGLGTAFLTWGAGHYKAFASEGGHAAFAPRSKLEVELLDYLQQRHSHVSFERVCSGGQLPNIFDFFVETRKYENPAWLQAELDSVTDRTPVIIRCAVAEQAEICTAVLDVFVSVLGTIVGNMAITLLPFGGIYLGGGIVPRILSRLKMPDFLSGIQDKGRFSELISTMPIYVITKTDAPLHGAACFGLEEFAKIGEEHNEP